MTPSSILLFVGDSVARQCGILAEEQGIGRRAVTQNGITSEQLLRLLSPLPMLSDATVVLHIGANDDSLPTQQNTLEAVMALKRRCSRVVVMLPTAAANLPQAQRRRVLYNAAAVRAAVDQFHRQFPEEGRVPVLPPAPEEVYDGLHPTQEGTSHIMEALAALEHANGTCAVASARPPRQCPRQCHLATSPSCIESLQRLIHQARQRVADARKRRDEAVLYLLVEEPCFLVRPAARLAATRCLRHKRSAAHGGHYTGGNHDNYDKYVNENPSSAPLVAGPYPHSARRLRSRAGGGVHSFTRHGRRPEFGATLMEVQARLDRSLAILKRHESSYERIKTAGKTAGTRSTGLRTNPPRNGCRHRL